MLKTLLTATAASALMLSAALAQTNTSPTSPTTPPAATPAMPAPASPKATGNMKAMPNADMKASEATTKKPEFTASQKSDQLLASKFKGTNVLGPNNEKVGDVSDVLFDKDGKVLAVIVGVGGFLGIGEKDVAIDMDSFQIVPASTGSSTASTATFNDPNKIKLKIAMTKDEIKSAPTFERYKANARSTSTSSTTNTGMAPHPMPGK
jgi:sporulation protein YlmC with PRC-barrel domain